MQITNMKIDNYIMNLMPERDEIQKEMEKYAKENNFPIIGPMVGRILRQLAIVTGAKNIFEMGSGYGYSAYWFAGGASLKMEKLFAPMVLKKTWQEDWNI